MSSILSRSQYVKKCIEYRNSYLGFVKSFLAGDKDPFFKVNTVAPDVLATQEAKSSKAVVLTESSWNIPVSSPEGFRSLELFNSLWAHVSHVMVSEILVNTGSWN